METKIAIRIDNKMQMQALMHHYHQKGFKHQFGIQPVYGTNLKAVEYKNGFRLLTSSDSLATYTVLPFDGLAYIEKIDWKDNVVYMSHGIKAEVNENGVRVVLPQKTEMSDFCISKDYLIQIMEILDQFQPLARK